MKLLIPTALFYSLITLSQAQDYQGAAAVLKQLQEKAGKKAEAKKADPVEELRQKIVSFRKEAATMKPEEAAKQWLVLVDAYLTIPQEQLYSTRAYEDRLDLNAVLAALPPVAAWDELARLLEKRQTPAPLQDQALSLLVAVLRGDEAARKKALAEMGAKATAQKDMDEYTQARLKEKLAEVSAFVDAHILSDEARVAAFEKQLAELEQNYKDVVERNGSNMEVPDLVRFAGEKKAASLLKRTLVLDLASLQIEGKATRLLAASLALQNIDSLKTPKWDLVHTLDHAALYEAMLKKFPKSKTWELNNAKEIYFLALIAEDRSAEAVKLLDKEAATGDSSSLSIPVSTLDELGRQGLGKKVLAFLERLLTSKPELQLWREYVELAAQQNGSQEALKLLQSTLARPELSAETRAMLQSHLYLALLAADQQDAGIAMLQDLVKTGPKATGGDGGASAVQEARQRWEQVGVHVSPEMLENFQAQARSGSDGGQRDHLGYCESLASIGKLLNRPELVEEAISAAQKTVETVSDASDREGPVHSLVRLLLKHDRGVEAEALLTGHLGRLVTPDDKRQGRQRLDESLGLLMSIYDKAGRYADALAVLEQCPYWAAPDLAAFESTHAGSQPLLVLAARALLEGGRKEDARRVIRRALQDYPSTDAVYELLLRAGSEEPLEPLLDQIAKRDRFEERPLIWKARVQLDAGKTEEAEKTIRAAIAIDPSDGEQGKGDRMRAYGILAEVLEKKGDGETAKVMRGAVSAIRKSEAADDWWSAGLLSEAVRRYEAALNDFADAYCIQSRLALRYSDLGQFEKAEQHYLRAFELMPESFGRVESHCFGCEGAFRGARAQNAADKVFTRLAGTPPVKPQVHYLLGYLRTAQDRPVEAADAFRLAVKQDPDYLNAWEKLEGLAEKVQMPREESENIALQIFRLDPAGRHSSTNMEQLRDLRQLWTTLLEAEKALPPTETGPLLPLTAAKARLESQSNPANGSTWDAWSYPSLFSRRANTRQHLFENALVSQARELLQLVIRN